MGKSKTQREKATGMLKEAKQKKFMTKMSKGGMMKKKGYAKGGMKKKGYAKGGVISKKATRDYIKRSN